jgi:TonB family protein
VLTVSGLPEGLWLGVASHLWQTTIVLGVLAALAGAMRRAPARFLNALWWIGLAKLLVPVQLMAPLVRRMVDPIAAEGARIRLPSITVWLGRAAPVLDPAAGTRGGLFEDAGALGVALALLWGAGAVWLVVCLFRARHRTTTGAAVGREGLPAGLRSRLDDAVDGTGIPATAIRVAAFPVMPATVGLLRRAIVVPEVLITRLGTSELRAVLLHEDAHRRRLDPLQAAVQRAATVAFYFFPLLWPLLSRLRETSEMACDEAAIARGVSPSDYSRALARTMSIGLEPLGLAAALAHGTSSFTRRRFDRLAHEGRFVVMKKHRFCLAIAALTVVAVSALSLALMADEGEGAAGTGNKISKGAAAPVAKAVAKAVAGAVATGVSGAVAQDGGARADADEAAAAEETEAEKDGASAEAAEERAGEAERAAIAEEAAEQAEEGAEEKTYTITLEHVVDPDYPEDARDDGVGGKVILKLTLHPNGEVGNVAVLEEVQGYPSLAEAAELAASEWIFRIEGDPEGDVEVVVPVEFKLHGEKTMEMSVRVPDAAETPAEPDAPAAPAAPEPDEPPAAPEPLETGDPGTP